MKIRSTFLLLAASHFTLSVSAQTLPGSAQTPPGSAQPLPGSIQPLPNSILWRISGKDGHHTSYLYGTMHLTDDRVFNLGDSLYAAIKNSDGLATELDPSALLSLSVEELEDQMVNGKNLKDILSDKDYKHYGPALAKKLKKPQGSITTDDILKQKHRWLTDQYAKGKMTTFLDMYLYEAARRQKKWTGGIEDAQDQRGYADAQESVDKSDIVDLAGKDQSGEISAELEKMISIYARQDLAAIDTLFGNSMDSVMLRRNHKMSRRIDSLSGVRSMVFAVGVAHLPGEQGLISLLRQKGFDVQPVFSSRKIKAADYPLPAESADWDTMGDENGFYRVSMPGKAEDIDMFHLFKMKMYYDFLDLNGYGAAAVPSAYRSERIDSIMDKAADRVFGPSSGRTFERASLNGAQGRLYTTKGDEGYKKGYFLYRDGIVYMAYGIAVKNNPQNRQNIDRFLKSFEVMDRKTDSASKMITYTDSALGFTIKIPAEAKLNNDKTTPYGHTRLYVCADPVDGGYYFFGANEVSRDRMVNDDSAFFRDLVKDASTKLNKIDFDTSWVVDGQLVTEYGGSMKGVDMTMRVRYVGRGNRWYPLLAMYPQTAKQTKIDKFFSSFSKLDYPAHAWKDAVSPDSLFKSWMPETIDTLEIDSADRSEIERQYISYDKTRAEGVNVVVYHLSPYYWANSDSAFWATRVDAHIKYTDTLISKKAVTNGEARGWEWIKRRRTAHNFERYRLLLYGDELYSLSLCGPYNEICSADADRYFEDFRFLKTPPPGSYFHSKATKLIDDLFLPDSAMAAKAVTYFNQAEFTKNDLPLLHKALLRISPVSSLSDKEAWQSRINNEIAYAIEHFKDTSSFRFAAQHYREIPESESNTKNNLLDLMSDFPDSLHFRTMAQLLHDSPPRQSLDWSFVGNLKDTLKLTSTTVPELLPLLKDSVMAPSLAGVYLQLLDSGLIDKPQFLPYRQDMLHHLASLTRNLLADSNIWKYNERDLILLCGRFDDEAGNRLLHKIILRVKNKPDVLAAIEGLLANKQPVDSTILRGIAADKTHRLDLYRLLEKAGHLNLFPAAYRTQKALGQSVVYEHAEEEEDLDDDVIITYLTTRTISTPEGKKNILFYKCGDGGSTYLACAGPFDPANTGKASPKDIRARIYFGKEFDNSELNAQIDALLQKFNDSGDGD